MNRFFRLVWSRQHGALVAIPETRTAPSGRGRRARRTAATLAALLMAPAGAQAQDPAPTQLPAGGTLRAGEAQIAVTEPGRMRIDQGSDRAVVDWDSFDVGAEARVDFNQPGRGSAILNRVTGAEASRIFGQVTANGQVFVTNRQGVYFSPGARVDVGGLVATTHGLSNERFMNRDLILERNGAEGSVINEGRLTAADGGYVGLLAPEVINEGVITARLGTVALGAGESFHLEIDDAGGLAGFHVEAGEIETLVENGGAILAPGGRVILSAGAAQDLRSGVVRNSGTIEAQGIREVGGRIFLGGARVESTSTSRIAASPAPDRSARPLQRPTQAQVHVDAAQARLSGTLSADGVVGGVVAIEADRITLGAGARLTATGHGDGGAVLVGGDWLGGASERRVFADADAMRAADRVEMAAGALIDVSAAAGAGGTAVLWSDVGAGGTTLAWGEIRAEGATGGQVETSGFMLDVTGIAVSTLAFDGRAGEWLLDPGNVTIATDGGDGIPGPGGPSGDVTIAPVTIEAALASNNVTIVTGTGADYMLNVDQPITYTGLAERTLTLGASGRILLHAGSGITATNAPLNVILAAEIDRATTQDNVSGFGVTLGEGIDTNGGDLWVGGGELTATWNGHTVGTGFAMGGAGNQNGIDMTDVRLSTGGGDVWIASSTNSGTATAGAIAPHVASFIDAGDGDVTLRVDRVEFDTSGSTLQIDTTGMFTLAPAGTSFETALTWNAPLSGGYYVGAGSGGGQVAGLRVSDTLTGFTLGGTGNAADVTVSSALDVAGAITLEGGLVEVSGALTSSATGDILLRGISGANPGVHIPGGGSVTKSEGTGTLTMQSHGRISNSGAIAATGTGSLNVVMWSDFDNDNDDGGVSHLGTISTGGGHVWMGGSNSAGGSATWNGLTVGDGPSIGVVGYNFNALDLFGNVATAGGDVLAWGGTGYTAGGGVSGIATDGDGTVLNTGAGDVTLIANLISAPSANSVVIDSSGHLTFRPDTNWDSTFLGGAFLNFTGTLSAGNFIGNAVPEMQWLRINDFASLSGFTLGRENGASGLSIDSPISIAGPISLLGAGMILDADLSTTVADADVRIDANDRVTASQSITTQGGNVVIIADSDGNGGEADIRIDGNIATNGGGIWVGGGFGDHGAGTTWDPGDGDAITVGGGFAHNGAAGTEEAGVWADTVLNTGGGNVAIYGYGVGTNGDGLSTGVWLQGDAITTAGGDVTIVGRQNSAATADYAVGVNLSGLGGGLSIATGAGDLIISGETLSTSNFNRDGGLWIGTVVNNISTSTGPVSLSTTSGNLSLSGRAERAAGSFFAHGLAIISRTGTGGGDDVIISTTTGDVTISGTGAVADVGNEATGVVFQNVAGSNATHSVTTDGGAITLNGESGGSGDPDIDLRNTGPSGVLVIGDGDSGALALVGDRVRATDNDVTLATGAALSVTSNAASFSNPFSTSGLTIGGTPIDVTFGSATNTAAVTIETPVSASGAIAATGGAVSLSADLSTTASTGAGVTVSGTSITQAAGVDVSTAGADVSYTVAAGAATADIDQLIHLAGDAGGAGPATIDAGGGDIDVSASFASGGAAGNPDRPVLLFDTVLQTSGAGAITVTGDAADTPTTAAAYGIELRGTNTLRTVDGAILLDGAGGVASTNSRGVVVDGHTASILSETGAITFIDRSPAGLTGTYNGFYLEPGSPGAIVIGADGSTLASSTSDITIRADRATFDTRDTLFDTTGSFVLEPLGTSFGAGIDTTRLALASGVGSVRIGAPTNTADVTLARAITAAGDIAVTGGTVTVNGGLSYGGGLSLTAATSDLLVNAPLNGTGTGQTVALRAGRHVRLGPTAAITATGATDTTLVADTDLSADGIVLVESAGIATAGGALSFGDAGQTATIDGQTVRVGGDVFFQSGTAQSLTTGGGDLTIHGETIVANTAGLGIATGGGDAHLFGLLNSGNAYTFVDRTGQPGSGSWSAARTDAINGTGGGAAEGDSYLVTITSRLENAIAGLVANYAGAWIGAWRPDLDAYGWEWADGPEAGTAFFEQSVSGGGSALTGFYSNFGWGEPNGLLGAGNEGRAQFFGDEGLWNDLPDNITYSATQGDQFAVLGFVRETNLAPSALTIDTGAGTLTVEGGIGTRTPFASLDVTAAQTLVNGEGIATTGAQDFSGTLDVDGGSDPVRLSASAITVGGAVAIDGGAISLQADLASAATSGTGITVAGTSIEQVAGVDVTTAGGDIAYTATGLVATAALDWAIALSGDRSGDGAVRIDAGGGDITLAGSFASGGVAGQSDRGLGLTNADIVTSGTGAISLTGDATLNPNTGTSAWGMQLSGTTIVTDAGDVALSGTGGAATANSRGIATDNRALSILSVSGAITVTDTRPAGLTGAYTGLYLRPDGAGNIVLGADGSTVATSTSDITIQADRATFDGLATEVTTTGGFVLEPVGTSFGAGVDTTNLALDAGASSARLGKAGNTGNITVGRALTVAGDISVLGGNLAIDHALSSTDGAPSATLGNVLLEASGTVTQGAAITASGLSLQGSGNFTLTDAGNAVATLAAGSPGTPVGSLAFVNGGAFAIGTVGAASGVTASGALAFATTSGDLTVAQPVTTTDATADAIVLNAGASATTGTAGGGNLILSGTPAVTTGAGGRARLFTGAVANSTGLAALVGLGSGNFRYNADETTDFSTGTWTDLGAAGVFGIYRERPSAGIADMTLSMTYGEGVPTVPATGLLNGDVSGVVITGEATSAAGFLAVGGSPYTIASSLPGLGYAVTGVSSGTLTVAPLDLTVTGLAGVDRAYDGTNVAAVVGTGALTGVLSGDTVGITGTAAGSFSGTDAATSVDMTVTGLGLGGPDAGNYALVTPTLSADILPRVVTLSAARAYDGTTDLTGSVTIATGVTGETLGYSGALAASAHVAGPDGLIGTADNTFAAIVLQDGTGLAGNYALPALDAASAPVTINPRVVTTSLSATGVDRPYDGTTAAAADYVPAFGFTGLAGGDTGLVLSYGGAAYDSADVLSATTLTVTGLSIAAVTGSLGSQAGDYALAATTVDVGAAITPAPLSVTANDDAKFVTQSDSAGFEGVRFEGFAAGETVADLGGTLSVTRSNAGQDAAGVYADVLVPSGLAASNYAITFLPGDYTIVPSDQLLVEVADQSHVYGSEAPYVLERVSYFDGSQEVRLDDASVAGSSVSVSSGNAVTVNDGASGTVSFALSPENAGLSGAGLIPAGSYQVALVGAATGNSANFSNVITVIGAHEVDRQAVTPSAGAGVTRTYDGTTNMAGVTIDLATPEVGDVVTGSGTGVFGDARAGTGKTYTISGVTLSGADAGNYRLSTGVNFSGSDGAILPRTLLVTFAGVDRAYDGTAVASVTASDDRVSGDDLSIARTASYDDKNVGTDRPVSVTAVSLSGADAGNYVVAPTGATTATITRLASVTWVGGPTGDWFDPANWAGGAVPDLANVAAVIIPEGVRVSFGTGAVPPAEAGPVELDSLGSAGTLVQSGGNLTVSDGGMTLGGYEQSGGALTVAGDMTLGSLTQTGGVTGVGGNLEVTETFEQTGTGTAQVAGGAELRDTSGGMSIGNLTVEGALAATSTDGTIRQSPGTAITVGGPTDLEAQARGVPADIDLSGPGNDFVGPLTARAGDLFIRDTNDLTLGDTDAAGRITVVAGRDVGLAGIISAGAVDLESLAGSVEQTAGSLSTAQGPNSIVAAVAVTLTQPGNALGGNRDGADGDLDAASIRLCALPLSLRRRRHHQRHELNSIAGGRQDQLSLARHPTPCRNLVRRHPVTRCHRVYCRAGA